MSRRCEITGRGPQVGNHISHAHNVTKRRFNINLQKVRVLINGQVCTLRISTKALKSGLVVKPPIILRERKIKVRPPVVESKTVVTRDEPVQQYFSSESVVTRLFKPKPKPVDAEEIAAAMADMEESQAAEEAEASPVAEKYVDPLDPPRIEF
ncbi:MAG: 50S ribosomal protein L28 [Calditrichota bacterium]